MTSKWRGEKLRAAINDDAEKAHAYALVVSLCVGAAILGLAILGVSTGQPGQPKATEAGCFREGVRVEIDGDNLARHSSGYLQEVR